jgi:hypothetical protein
MTRENSRLRGLSQLLGLLRCNILMVFQVSAAGARFPDHPPGRSRGAQAVMVNALLTIICDQFSRDTAAWAGIGDAMVPVRRIRNDQPSHVSASAPGAGRKRTGWTGPALA